MMDEDRMRECGRSSRDNEQRTNRSRHDDLEAYSNRVVAYTLDGTPTRLVEIYNGGSLPTDPDHFYLGYPVTVSGTEAEGGAGAASADTVNAIVVDVLGHAPAVGDILTAYAIGGRWIAERGGSRGVGTVSCQPCAIPKESLTVSWTNPLGGNGFTTLAYTPSGMTNSWQSGCANGLLYQLYCTSNQVELRVLYFVSGSCPSGQIAYCSNLRSAPFGLAFVSYTCSPFSLTFQTTLSSCPVLVNNGYQFFTVTL
jgi:hypothetical protein